MTEQPVYIYTCAQGHENTSRTSMVKCYAYVLGVPCPGTLKQTSGPRRRLVPTSTA